MVARRQADRDLLEWCREERNQAMETLRLIKQEGWTFHETRGHEPMRDVTAERAERQKKIIRLMDRVIERYEGRGG